MKNKLKILFYVLLVAGIATSLYWNYLTAARLDNLAQDMLYFKQEYYEEQENQQQKTNYLLFNGNDKKIKDLELELSIQEARNKKEIEQAKSDAYWAKSDAYWNKIKTDELNKKQQEIQKSIEDKETWDRLHQKPDRGGLLPY